MRSAARLFRVQLLVAGLGLGTLALIVAVASSAISFAPGSLTSVWQACQRLLPSLDSLAWLELVLAGAGLSAVALGLRSAARQLLATRRYLNELRPATASVIVDGTSCAVIEGGEPQAFCAGLLRPRVYLSRGALASLTADELRAVVAHERHHRRRRDPLRLLVMRALADGLFFLPALKRMSSRYASLVELAADEAAVEALGERRSLARALLRFGAAAPGLAVAGISPERIGHLDGDRAASRWQLSSASIALSAALAAAIVLGSLAVLVSGPAPVDLTVVLAQSCVLLVSTTVAAVLLAGTTAWRRSRLGARA